MKVFNLLGHKNQFIVYHYDTTYFQSYDTLMATLKRLFKGGYVKKLEINSHYWSATTAKYMKAFLEETHTLDTVLKLIHKYKLFRNFKDFMERAETVELFMMELTVNYKNNRGEVITFTCNIYD